MLQPLYTQSLTWQVLNHWLNRCVTPHLNHLHGKDSPTCLKDVSDTLHLNYSHGKYLTTGNPTAVGPAGCALGGYATLSLPCHLTCLLGIKLLLVVSGRSCHDH